MQIFSILRIFLIICRHCIILNHWYYVRGLFCNSEKAPSGSCAKDYQLIVGQLYKLGLDSILRHCVLDHERPDILWECHSGVVGGHVGRQGNFLKGITSRIMVAYNV
jgi:hypothetical protein